MDARFNEIDNKLNTIYSTMQSDFATVTNDLNLISTGVANLTRA